MQIKVTNVGNSLGLILSKEIVGKLNVEKGDKLYAFETPHGIEITPYDPGFVEQIEAAKHIMKKDRNVLRKLAE